jgi:oligopeptide transport system substrate-binding protein
MPESPYRQAPLLATYYYLFNTLRAPVDDVRVRQALAYAIDRATLISAILQDAESPSPALTPPGIPGYQPPEIINYDPAAARQLLAEAGYPDGQGWPGMVFTYNSSDNNRKIAVAIQQMWKVALNIDVTLANQEWKVFLDTINQMEFQVARMGWTGGYIDPNTFLGKFISGGGTNRTGFTNARYDEILQHLAPSAEDPIERLQLLREAETILMEQMPVIPLYTYNSKHLIHHSVRGVPSNVLDLINFKYVSLSEIPDRRHRED